MMTNDGGKGRKSDPAKYSFATDGYPATLQRTDKLALKPFWYYYTPKNTIYIYIYMMLYVILLLWQLSGLCRLYDAYLVYSSNHATVIDEHVHEAVTSLSPLWSFPLNTCEPRPAISQHLCFIHQQRQGRTPLSATP